jgi:hypothetical protein
MDRLEDGTEEEFGPGESCMIPTGHDARGTLPEPTSARAAAMSAARTSLMRRKATEKAFDIYKVFA